MQLVQSPSALLRYLLAIFSGIPLAATPPVPLNKIELTVGLEVKDNQLPAALQFNCC